MINKRYKDLIEQYIHKGEPTPFSVGTIVVFELCFLMLIVATFSQIHFSYPQLSYSEGSGFSFIFKTVAYSPQIPIMIFIIYILGKSYSVLLFLIYLIIGLFFCPIFAFGGGIDYIQNYFFGYLIGFVGAIFIAGYIFKINQFCKTRLLGAILGVFTIHITGFIYCIILAIFRMIDFGIIPTIVSVISLKNIIYDIIFSSLIILIAPYVKNILWICMKPRYNNKKKKLKNPRIRHQIVSDNINEHGENNN